MTGAPTPPTAAPFSGIGAAVAGHCAGVLHAQQLMHAIREGGAPADLVHDAISQVNASPDEDLRRGFARELQKRLAMAMGAAG